MTEPVQHYTFFIPKQNKLWINSNDRIFWMERNRRTQAWRAHAKERAQTMQMPAIGCAHVICELVFSDRRRRDPANWAPTAKAVVDGLVDAGVFPDDDYKHVTGPDMRIGEPSVAINHGLRLHIFPKEQSA